MAVKQGLDLHQIDVETAFPQTDEEDDDPTRPRTYLRPSREKGDSKNALWRILKSVYGLRSAPASWKKTLVRWLHSVNFQSLMYDDCILVSSDQVIVMIYVDDLVILGPPDASKKFIKALSARFTCTPPKRLADSTEDSPLELLGHDLWMGVNEDGEKVVVVSQERYARAIVAKFGLEGANALSSMRSEDFESQILQGGALLDGKGLTMLRSIVGAIQYLAQGTRLDLLCPVSTLAEGQSAGADTHVATGKKLVRYIAGTCSRRLEWPVTPVKPGDRISFELVFDASFCPGKARSGGIPTIDGDPVFWYSRRQKCIVLSTTEAELISASQGARELRGARNSIMEVWDKFPGSDLRCGLSMCGDSTAANPIASRQSSLRKVRHLTLADLFVREFFETDEVTMRQAPTTEMTADCLTKVLPENKLKPLLPLIRLTKCVVSKVKQLFGSKS